MKKLALIAIALFTINASAQEHRQRHGKHKKEMAELYKSMTAEELAELKTKEMTLKLDLSDNQQTKIYDLLVADLKVKKQKRAERQEKSEGEKKELSKEELLKLKNERLDAQIAMKKQFKSILSDEQYEKFEKSMKKRKGGHKKKAKHRRN